VISSDDDDDVGAGLEVVTGFELKELILCWTRFLTHILSMKSL